MSIDLPCVQKNILLQNKNTFRIGGQARFYCEPQSEQEIIDLLKWTSDSQIPVFVLGKGSNVLISDNGWPGLVVNLSEKFTGIIWNGLMVEAMGGASLHHLTGQAVGQGKSGLEELTGIPGTIAGAVVMNAGAFDSCIADTLSYVRYYDCRSDQIIRQEASGLALGYRNSVFRHFTSVILSAGFELHNKISSERLACIRKDILSMRKSKQPLEFPNCGSVFKRPEGKFAGTLIEQCGLKGTTVGNVQVSQKHANFIINKGCGTASDVRKLIRLIQKKVYEHFAVLLEPEVIFIGEFEEPLFLPFLE